MLRNFSQQLLQYVRNLEKIFLVGYLTVAVSQSFGLPVTAVNVN